jgi:hypothetical protein
MDEPRRPGTMATHDPDTTPTHTVDQLRGEIDAGHAGDKAAASDPAMSPLGTDDEAGGHSNAREQIEQARREETRKP